MERINVDEEVVNVVFEIVFYTGFSAVALVDEIYICKDNFLSDCKSTLLLVVIDLPLSVRRVHGRETHQSALVEWSTLG